MIIPLYKWINPYPLNTSTIINHHQPSSFINHHHQPPSLTIIITIINHHQPSSTTIINHQHYYQSSSTHYFVLGSTSQVLVSLAFLGGSLCAAFVVSLAATWALCEAAESDDAVTALEQSPRDDAGPLAGWGNTLW